MVAGQIISNEQLRHCDIKAINTLQCVDGYVDVAGTRSFVMTTVFGSKLSSMVLSSDQDNWTKLRAAFIAKYGQPCSQNVESWQNAAGASLKNISEDWCFATGKLNLRQYGYRITETSAVYIDDNKVPEPAPKVDF